MEKAAPSSDEKEFIGDRVPDVRTMERACVRSEKAWKEIQV